MIVNTSRRVQLADVRRDPRAALAIRDRDDPRRYVRIRGRVTAFDRRHGAADLDRLSQRYRGHPYRYPSTDRPENRITIVIEPEAVTARIA